MQTIEKTAKNPSILNSESGNYYLLLQYLILIYQNIENFIGYNQIRSVKSCCFVGLEYFKLIIQKHVPEKVITRD